jgi:hypothetical protein
VFCGFCAVVAFGLALGTGTDLSMTGFPDSHLTDYDKAVDVPKHILLSAHVGLGLLLVVLALLPINPRTRNIVGAVALAVVAAIAVIQWVGVPWYFGTHLGLDNGIGG